MLYENYENRLKKIAKIRIAIYKFRLLIIAVAAVILAGIAALIACKGIITQDTFLSSRSITYGSDYSVNAKAFLSGVEFEFSGDDGVWRAEKPYRAGSYKVRAVTDRAFGGTSYGEPVDFEILPKDLTVSFNQSITYGEDPVFSEGLVGGDTLTVLKTRKLRVGEYDFSFSAQDFAVNDAFGVDVASCYDIVYQKGVSITVLPRNLNVNSFSAEKVYDGTALVLEKFSATETVYDEVLSVEFLSSQTDAGFTENVVSATVFGGDENVTENYNIVYTFGVLRVLKRDIEIVPEDESKIYDGEVLTPKTLKITDGELVLGHAFYDVAFLGEIINVGTKIGEVDLTRIKITDGASDKTHNYNIKSRSSFLAVNKRPVKPVLKDSKVYDDAVFSAEQFAYETEGFYLPVEGHKLYVSTVSSDADVYSGDKLLIKLKNGEQSVLNNYDVDISEFTLTISPRPLTVAPQDESHVYNAEYLYPNVLLIKEGSLVNGHMILNKTFSGQMIDAGETASEVVSIIIIRQSSFSDVTFNYEITKRQGKLTVSPRGVQITVSGGKVYDDSTEVKKEYLSLEFTLDGGKTSLYSDHVCEYLIESELSSPSVGSYVLDTKFSKITSNGGTVDVSGNYSVTWQNGEFTVDRRGLTLSTGSLTVQYDRAEHSVEEIEIVSGSLVEGHNLIATFPKLTKVGEISNTPEIIIESVEKTANYEVYVISGTLKVTRRTLNVTLYETNIVYDGTSADIDDRFWIQDASQLLEGDAVNYVYDFTVTDVSSGSYVYGDIVNAGTYDLQAKASVNYFDGSYTDYYDVTVSGRMIISKAEILLVSETASAFYYEGIVFTANSYYLSYGAFASCDTVEVLVTGSLSERGETKNTVEYIQVNGERRYPSDGSTYEFINYTVTVSEGTLTLY